MPTVADIGLLRLTARRLTITKRITVQLIGLSSDKKDVYLDAFIEQLTSVKRALRENELDILGGTEPSIDYKVVDLRHSSPATVVLEPVALNESISVADMSDVIDAFAGELSLIRRKGQLLTEPELARLTAYKALGFKGTNRIDKVTIRTGRRSVTIDRLFKRKLDAIIGPDEFDHGSVSGMLEAVNFHNANRFTVYPPVGPPRMQGTFSARLRPAVKEAIGNFVTVFGKLAYKGWSPYPHSIIAESIDIHEPESKLPKLSVLRGAFRGCLGEMNSAEFVDSLRDEDW